MAMPAYSCTSCSLTAEGNPHDARAIQEMAVSVDWTGLIISLVAQANYRYRVLSALPYLKKLDFSPVTPQVRLGTGTAVFTEHWRVGIPHRIDDHYHNTHAHTHTHIHPLNPWAPGLRTQRDYMQLDRTGWIISSAAQAKADARQESMQQT